MQSLGVPEPIPETTGARQGITQDEAETHRGPYTAFKHTCTWGEHANSTHMEPEQ